MTGVRTAPFLCPDPRLFELGPWFKDDVEPLEDRMLLTTWEPVGSFTMSRLVQLKLDLVLLGTGLEEGTRLALVPTWWSPGTGLRGRGTGSILVAGECHESQFTLAMTIPNDELSGSVQIKTALVLMQRARNRKGNALAAVRPGSVLWHDYINLTIEGDAARFPITAVDFVESNIGESSACWRLDWSPRDLELPAMACLRLWINNGHESFYRAMIAPTAAPEDIAIRSALRFEVGAEMLRLALAHVDELEHSDFDFGSTGRVFLDLIDRLFPDQSPRKVAELLTSDPASFSTVLQAKTGLFSDVPSSSRKP